MIALSPKGRILFLSWPYLLTSQLILIPFFILYFGSNGATVFGALFSEQFPTETRSTGVSAALQISRGDVIQAGVAENIRRDIFRGLRARAAAADDEG